MSMRNETFIPDELAERAETMFGESRRPGKDILINQVQTEGALHPYIPE